MLLTRRLFLRSFRAAKGVADEALGRAFMTASFCTRCGTQQVPGAAFCPACGQAAAAQPAPPAYQQPPYQQQQPYGAPPPMGSPPRQGMSSNTKIGIAIAVLLAIVIGYYVNQNEQEFQRNRRAGQNPPASAPANPQQQAPAAQGQQQGDGSTPAYKGYESGGTPGTPEWTRNQLIGRWSVRGCQVSTVEFRQDGTTFSAAGNETLSGTWTYQHPRLTVVEQSNTTVLEIISMGDEMVTDFQGRRQTWRRC